MKRIALFLLITLPGVAMSLSAQSPVQTSPGFSEIPGATVRGNLRQPYTGGFVIAPAWMLPSLGVGGGDTPTGVPGSTSI